MTGQKLLMTASSRNDDEVVSLSDTSRSNNAEMAVSKSFPSGRAHSAHLLRYGSLMMRLQHVSRRQALQLNQMGTADRQIRVVSLLNQGFHLQIYHRMLYALYHSDGTAYNSYH